MLRQIINESKEKERPSVETDGLNDCLPYEKRFDEFAEGRRSNFFICVVNKRRYLFMIKRNKWLQTGNSLRIFLKHPLYQ